MSQVTVAAGLSFTAQFITAAVMAFLLAGFYRQFQKAYVLHWMLSWTALAVSQLAFVAVQTVAAHSNVAPIHPFLIAPAMAAIGAFYLHVTWLAFGVVELIRRRHVRLRDARQTLMAAAVAGGVTAVVTALVGGGRIPQQTPAGIPTFLAALAFASMAVVLWRARNSPTVGRLVLSAALGALALHHLQETALAFMLRLPSDVQQTDIYAGVVQLLLLSLIGLGMIAALLEDEREAAAVAADQVEHLAYHDALTGLPNRPLFMDRLIVALAQASRSNHKLAVFFLDLDRFKDINDSLGHTVGDTLLKSAAERVRRCVREGDTVARFGGDEFTLLIPKIDKIEDAAKIAEKIITALKQPSFVINEQELVVTTSIGVAIYPNDGLDPETLVRNSDSAMYRAKDQGRDGYQLYASDMNAKAVERLALEATLRRAVSEKQLVLHYQPVLEAATGMIIGVEALIRWKHPKKGLLPPAEFISLAEVSGLIVPIGEWVVKTACRQQRVWEKKFDRPLIMSVNLSARQFQHPEIVEHIRAALQETDVDPASVEIEITESSAMQNVDQAVFTLRELKSLGVQIAMDDFGTGYSSLNYLKRFPIDLLKLDQTFVREVMTDDRDAAIVGAVIAMAHRLGLKVIAEGVETEEQLKYLKREGCDYIQGFLYSRPLPADDFETFLEEHKSDLTAR